MTDARSAKSTLSVLVLPVPNALSAKSTLSALVLPVPDALSAKSTLSVLVIPNGASAANMPFWGTSPGTTGEFWSSVF